MSNTSEGEGSRSRSKTGPETNSSRMSHRRQPDVRVIRSFSPGPNEWHPAIDSQRLFVPRRRGSSSGASSLVQDNGDAQQLLDFASERDGVVFAPFNDLSYVGGAFDQDTNSIRSRLSLSSIDTDVPVAVEDAPPSPEKSKRYLQKDIWLELVESLDKDSQFLPLSSLREIVTPENIIQELKNYHLDLKQRDLAGIAQQVLEVLKCGTGRGEEWTCRRKLFAVLAMIKKSDAIVDIIHEDLYDHDLPFDFQKGGEVLRKKRDGGEPKRIKFFSRWQFQDLQFFNTFQWVVMAPYFKLSWEPGQRVYQYTLAPRDILPFLEESMPSTTGSQELDFSGGTSTVRKVKIHKAHYRLPPKLAKTCGDDKLYFAVKTLRISDQLAQAKGREVNREALALKRFVDVKDKDKAHHHLIRLLATYSHKNHFHMIFPCADGNLLDFWQRQPDCNFPAREPTLARWMIRQCLGLARALEKIHMSNVDGSNPQGLDPHFRKKQHGRHGDIKPENILHFAYEDCSSMGILKIADFGFADFHRTTSLNVFSKSSIGGMTLTYRAPEYDVIGRVSPAYDIWSFGCVLMQFIVWYADGWGGIEAFSEKRVADSRSIIPGDDFFNFIEAKSAAKTKASVTQEFDRLRNHDACSEFILDLLDFVKSDMLRLKPQRRASCAAIVRKLEAIWENCENNDAYCAQRFTRDVRHTPSDESEFVRYSQPPKNRADPINIVDAASIAGASNSASPGPQSRRHSVSVSDSLTSWSQPSETTPLINGAMVAERVPGDYDHDEAYSAPISLRARIARFFMCCFGGSG